MTIADATVLSDDWRRHHFDHLAPELRQPLPDVLAWMREHCPVARSDQHGGFWVVTGYAEVQRVAQDWETYSSAHGTTVPVAPVVTTNLPEEVDPPIQRAYKRLVNTFLTPAKVAPWEPATRALVTTMIDAFAERGACEFMREFARPFPSQTFFDLALNAPADQIDRVAHLASKASTPHDPEAKECWAGLSAWITDFLAARRRQPPRDDVVSGILGAEIDGRPVTHDEVVGMLQLLILGGLETTAGALGLMMTHFCAHPQIPEALRRDPSLVPAAIEELLRLDGPFIAIARTVMCDTDLGGQRLAAGDKVLLYWSSANRDECAFARADTFDLERGSNRHVAFGLGPHRCAGSNVARLNLRVAVGELVGRLHDLRLAPGAQVEYHSTFTRSPLALPIQFTPTR